VTPPKRITAAVQARFTTRIESVLTKVATGELITLRMAAVAMSRHSPRYSATRPERP
jgi:hypothetical protein